MAEAIDVIEEEVRKNHIRIEEINEELDNINKSNIFKFLWNTVYTSKFNRLAKEGYQLIEENEKLIGIAKKIYS